MIEMYWYFVLTNTSQKQTKNFSLFVPTILLISTSTLLTVPSAGKNELNRSQLPDALCRFVRLFFIEIKRGRYMSIRNLQKGSNRTENKVLWTRIKYNSGSADRYIRKNNTGKQLLVIGRRKYI